VKIDFSFPHYTDAGIMKLNKNEIMVVFWVHTWAGDGTLISENRYVARFDDWPPAFTNDVRDVYDKIEQYAISQGYISDGIGEIVEPDSVP
jgi:hypothetical protein